MPASGVWLSTTRPWLWLLSQFILLSKVSARLTLWVYIHPPFCTSARPRIHSPSVAGKMRLDGFLLYLSSWYFRNALEEEKLPYSLCSISLLPSQEESGMGLPFCNKVLSILHLGGGSAEFGVSPDLSDTAFLAHLTIHPLCLARARCWTPASTSGGPWAACVSLHLQQRLCYHHVQKDFSSLSCSTRRPSWVAGSIWSEANTNVIFLESCYLWRR